MISSYNAQSGNVMVYLLLALGLIGFLTFTLLRQNDQAGQQDIDNEQLALYAQDLISYAHTAGSAVEMMEIQGSRLDQIDLTAPDQAAFNTGSPIHKLYHPQGGGLLYQASLPSAISGTAAQWAMNNTINVEWTASTGTDILLTAYDISRAVCSEINRYILGNDTIPVTANSHDNYFLDSGTTNLDATECSDCEGYSSLCVQDSSGGVFSYYTIIGAQ